MGMPFPPLPSGQFDIIYADPPWDYKGQLQHAGEGSQDTGGAARHYPTVTLDDLKTLDVPSISARDCLLFMWATNPHLDQAIDLGKAWGFAWATVAFVWDKVRVNPGFYTMSQCELCLVFKKGKIPSPRGARNVRQLVTAKREAHSQKPGEVRLRIDKCSLFSARSSCSRASRTGSAWPIPIGRVGGSKLRGRRRLERCESWQDEAVRRRGPMRVRILIPLIVLFIPSASWAFYKPVRVLAPALSGILDPYCPNPGRSAARRHGSKRWEGSVYG